MNRFQISNAKDSHILSTKNNSVFAYVVGMYLTSWGLNDDVKLTKFWATGPRCTCTWAVRKVLRLCLLYIAVTDARNKLNLYLGTWQYIMIYCWKFQTNCLSGTYSYNHFLYLHVTTLGALWHPKRHVCYTFQEFSFDLMSFWWLSSLTVTNNFDYLLSMNTLSFQYAFYCKAYKCSRYRYSSKTLRKGLVSIFFCNQHFAAMRHPKV